jgi:hypothetical protein
VAFRPSEGATEVNEQKTDRATIWVCAACGKKSRDLYGEKAIDGGWDESCMLNAVEVDEATGEVVTPLPKRRTMPSFAEILAQPLAPELLEEARKTLDALSAAAQIGAAVTGGRE